MDNNHRKPFLEEQEPTSLFSWYPFCHSPSYYILLWPSHFLILESSHPLTLWHVGTFCYFPLFPYPPNTRMAPHPPITFSTLFCVVGLSWNHLIDLYRLCLLVSISGWKANLKAFLGGYQFYICNYLVVCLGIFKYWFDVF